MIVRWFKINIKKIVPARYRYRFVSTIKNIFGGFGHTFYSQNGEDVILASLFKKKKGGFYVDVGAHHPERYSNTYLLYKKGWRGINIDPDPALIRLFERKRKRDINLCVGISRERGERPFYIFSDPAVNTFSPAFAELWQKEKWIELREKVLTKTTPLREVFDHAVPKDTPVDFLNIDAEGLDLEVLESNDWGRFRPKVIAIEAHDFRADAPAESAVYRFLREKGYKLHAVMKFSLIFVSEGPRT